MRTKTNILKKERKSHKSRKKKKKKKKEKKIYTVYIDNFHQTHKIFNKIRVDAIISNKQYFVL